MERQRVAAELESLVASFQQWAVNARRRKRDTELQFLAERVLRQRRLDQELWAKRFDALEATDLTPTEAERFTQHVINRTVRINRPMEAALDALAKTRKLRDRNIV